MPGPHWWAVLGALLVTTGSGLQAVREVASFRRFYESVLDAQEAIVDDEVRALVSRTQIFQFWRRREVRDRVRRDGEQLLTEEEKATRRDIDLRYLGWVVVFSGGVVTTGAALASALMT